MDNLVGEVTIVKRNVETGEEETYTQKNTQLIGMLRNLSATTAPGWATSSTPNQIFITDSANVLNRLTASLYTNNATFNVAGTVISGEFWPQYSVDSVNNRAVFTFKQRFQPGASTRTINSIGLYTSSYGQLVAGLKLQTPCVQTTLDIVDIFYKIYVYYNPTAYASDRNVNTGRLVYSNTVARWFYSSQTVLYAEGTSTNLITSGTWYDQLSLIPSDQDLRQTSATYIDSTASYTSSGWQYFSVTPTTTTSNPSQGTVLRSLTLATTSYVGYLINKVALTRWEWGLSSSNGVPVSAAPVLSSGDTRIQSVYLKSASSTATNFAYLDPSTIGSSTATPVLNDSTWTDPQVPSMFKISITNGGTISTATYKIAMRNCLGFLANFFNNERPHSMNNVFRRLSTGGLTYEPYVNNTFNNRSYNIRRLNDKQVVSYGTNGITISNIYDSSFVNYDATSTPALVTSGIVTALPMPDGSILIATTDKGLLKMSADKTSITQFTGIGSGVNDNICYAVDYKFNGDIWAMFEGGLARYTQSSNTWTVYNSTTPITFIHSEYNPTWNNTLHLWCRKDAASDEILLSRANGAALTWWSPTSPTPVNTSGSGTLALYKYAGTVRGDYRMGAANLPGTSVWYFQNGSGGTSRITFGTNSAAVASAYALNGTYLAAVYRPMLLNGNWVIQAYEMPNTVSGNPFNVRYYNATSLVSAETNINLQLSIGTSNYITEVMDDYGTGIFVMTSGSSTYNVWVYNVINPLSSASWREYGWDSGTSQWVLGHSGSKPVHTALQDIPDGLKLGFTPTGTNDFITGERWIGYITDGLHKDNSTNAVVNLASQTRNSYTTTDLSTTTVPGSGLGSVTENFSTYTLDNNIMSWNGITGASNSPGNGVAQAVRSELILSGDFTYNFYASQFTENGATVGNTTTYIGMYESAISPTSKWSFRFTSAGYAVTEDDTVKTSVVLPGAADKFTIKRVGSTITYLVNDVLFYTSTITNANPVRGIMRIAPADGTRTFYNQKITYNETRPVIRIGSAVNQTGVYDTQYAMIEAWLTNPRTISVTINGVAATVITDPTVAPAAGQVLLLQKLGWLVFNSADAGKTVTCSALVLQET